MPLISHEFWQESVADIMSISYYSQLSTKTQHVYVLFCATAHYDLWLDPEMTDKTKIMSYLNSAPSGQLVTYPISPWVNSLKHDDERSIEP
jgi:putative SOS response-associated peptidase YedK